MSDTTINKSATEKAVRLVFKAEIARQLLKDGCQIVDIKPDKSNRARTVFCFANDEKFQNAFNQILNDLADQRQKERRKERKEFNKEVEQKGA